MTDADLVPVGPGRDEDVPGDGVAQPDEQVARLEVEITAD